MTEKTAADLERDAAALIEAAASAYATADSDDPQAPQTMWLALRKLLRLAHQLRATTAATLRWVADRPDLLDAQRLRQLADAMERD